MILGLRMIYQILGRGAKCLVLLCDLILTRTNNRDELSKVCEGLMWLMKWIWNFQDMHPIISKASLSLVSLGLTYTV